MNQPKTKISRRSFLRGAGLAGLAGLGVGGTLSAQNWIVPSEAKAETKDTVAYTYHQAHCGGMCPMKCTVRDGRLVMIEPNNACGMDRQKTICLKGLSEVQHIYGQGRIQTPLKRVGERGDNNFEQVSWEEALDDIAKRIKDLQVEHGKQSVLVTTSSEADMPYLQAMLGAQGRGKTGIDVGHGNGLDPALGFGAGYAMTSPEARDWTESRLVLTVGSNFCESTLPQVRMFFEAKEAGAHMVTVDPHFSTTASKSDEWVPIEPGTDPALYLGMLNHIVSENLYDEEFMRAHTSLTFLVDRETGKILREHEPKMVIDPETGEEKPETGEQNAYYVIGTDGEVHDALDANGVLSGSVDYEGRMYDTVYSIFEEQIASFTPEWASEITSIPADKIKELATEYSKGPSSLALGWGGNDKISNADIAGHAAAMLTALTGNIGKPGAGVGVYVGGTWSCHTAALGEWALPEDMVPAENEMSVYDMRTKPNSVRALIACGDTICQHYANMSVTEKWVKTLDLVVSIDPYFTEGCKWADYILPSTTRFEYDDEIGNIKNGYNQIVMQQKVIDPLFEAKTDLWIQKEIARRLGFEDALPASAKERVAAILANSTDPAIQSLTSAEIAENNGVWPIEGAEKPHRVVEDLLFPTPSGRMEVYYENLVNYHQALPQWEAPVEISADNPLRKTYPLQMANVRTRFHIHNQFQDAEWISQFYRPTIEINPTEMESRGLKTGDEVRVFNDRGEMNVYVHGNASIRPGSARLYENVTADFTLKGNMQSLTNDTTLERGYQLMCGPVIPYSDTLVEIEKA